MYKIGLVFLAVWLVISYLVFSREEPPIYLSLIPLVLPFAQVLFFTIFRSDRQRRKIGAVLMTLLVGFQILFQLRVPVPYYGFATFLALFMVVAFGSAVLHTFYDYGRNEGRKASTTNAVSQRSDSDKK